MNIQELIKKVEDYHFDCALGALVDASDWHGLKEEIAKLQKENQEQAKEIHRLCILILK